MAGQWRNINRNEESPPIWVKQERATNRNGVVLPPIQQAAAPSDVSSGQQNAVRREYTEHWLQKIPDSGNTQSSQREPDARQPDTSLPATGSQVPSRLQGPARQQIHVDSLANLIPASTSRSRSRSSLPSELNPSEASSSSSAFALSGQSRLSALNRSVSTQSRSSLESPPVFLTELNPSESSRSSLRHIRSEPNLPNTHTTEDLRRLQADVDKIKEGLSHVQSIQENVTNIKESMTWLNYKTDKIQNKIKNIGSIPRPVEPEYVKKLQDDVMDLRRRVFELETRQCLSTQATPRPSRSFGTQVSLDSENENSEETDEMRVARRLKYVKHGSQLHNEISSASPAVNIHDAEPRDRVGDNNTNCEQETNNGGRNTDSEGKVDQNNGSGDEDDNYSNEIFHDDEDENEAQRDDERAGINEENNGDNSVVRDDEYDDDYHHHDNDDNIIREDQNDDSAYDDEEFEEEDDQDQWLIQVEPISQTMDNNDNNGNSCSNINDDGGNNSSSRNNSNINDEGVHNSSSNNISSRGNNSNINDGDGNNSSSSGNNNGNNNEGTQESTRPRPRRLLQDRYEAPLITTIVHAFRTSRKIYTPECHIRQGGRKLLGYLEFRERGDFMSFGVYSQKADIGSEAQAMSSGMEENESASEMMGSVPQLPEVSGSVVNFPSNQKKLRAVITVSLVARHRCKQDWVIYQEPHDLYENGLLFDSGVYVRCMKDKGYNLGGDINLKFEFKLLDMKNAVYTRQI